MRSRGYLSRVAHFVLLARARVVELIAPRPQEAVDGRERPHKPGTDVLGERGRSQGPCSGLAKETVVDEG